MYSTDTATSRDRQLFSSPGPSGVHAGVRSLLIALVAAMPLAAGSCGRTALEPIHPSVHDAGTDAPVDLPSDRMDAPRDLVPEMPMEHQPDLPPEHPPPPPDGPVCVPMPETCNGVDDDCNGATDEAQPPIPCPNGGFRYCAGGHYSECPRRCDVCVPGSKRTCITSFCTFWGSQTCASDGRSFGDCKESQPPPECKAVADRMMRSRELEVCCRDNGYCCVDEFDLDGDGDRTEMIGRCESVTCD
jgi:hypothetical protein